MIKETDILTLFENSGIPVFRGHAPAGTEVPFAVYSVDYQGNFGADDITYQKIPSYRLDLYNATPDLTVREIIETILTDAGLFWRSEETDDPDQRLFITYYYFGG